MVMLLKLPLRPPKLWPLAWGVRRVKSFSERFRVGRRSMVSRCTVVWAPVWSAFITGSRRPLTVTSVSSVDASFSCWSKRRFWPRLRLTPSRTSSL